MEKPILEFQDKLSRHLMWVEVEEPEESQEFLLSELVDKMICDILDHKREYIVLHQFLGNKNLRSEHLPRWSHLDRPLGYRLEFDQSNLLQYKISMELRPKNIRFDKRRYMILRQRHRHIFP